MVEWAIKDIFLTSFRFLFLFFPNRGTTNVCHLVLALKFPIQYQSLVICFATGVFYSILIPCSINWNLRGDACASISHLAFVCE